MFSLVGDLPIFFLWIVCLVFWSSHSLGVQSPPFMQPQRSSHMTCVHPSFPSDSESPLPRDSAKTADFLFSSCTACTSSRWNRCSTPNALPPSSCWRFVNVPSEMCPCVIFHCILLHFDSKAFHYGIKTMSADARWPQSACACVNWVISSELWFPALCHVPCAPPFHFPLDYICRWEGVISPLNLYFPNAVLKPAVILQLFWRQWWWASSAISFLKLLAMSSSF